MIVVILANIVTRFNIFESDLYYDFNISAEISHLYHWHSVNDSYLLRNNHFHTESLINFIL